MTYCFYFIESTVLYSNTRQ